MQIKIRLFDLIAFVTLLIFSIFTIYSGFSSWLTSGNWLVLLGSILLAFVWFQILRFMIWKYFVINPCKAKFARQLKRKGIWVDPKNPNSDRFSFYLWKSLTIKELNFIINSAPEDHVLIKVAKKFKKMKSKTSNE